MTVTMLGKPGILGMLRVTGILEGILETIGIIGTIESTENNESALRPNMPQMGGIYPGTCRLSLEQLRWLGSRGNARSSRSPENLEFGW